jgi:4-hydroxy-tetrahydrodipicolinate synthase
MYQARGIIPALVSPIDSSGVLKEASFRALIEYLLDNGVHGLFINGSQGEFYALSAQEKEKILEIAIDQNRSRVPIYAGVGAVTTREAVILAKTSQKVGANALSAITPYFIKPTEKELYAYYKAIADAVSLPVLLYGNPDRTNVALSPNLVAKLSHIENIVGIKDSSGDFTLTSEYIRLLSSKGFQVLAGRDTLILATLVYGGVGAIAASANVAPKLVVEIDEAYKQGDLVRALEAQHKIAPLRMAFNLGTFPVVIKEALRLIGIDMGLTILPVEGIAASQRLVLRRILQELELPVRPDRGS